jgi:hypothetical protein
MIGLQFDRFPEWRAAMPAKSMVTLLLRKQNLNDQFHVNYCDVSSIRADPTGNDTEAVPAPSGYHW